MDAADLSHDLIRRLEAVEQALEIKTKIPLDRKDLLTALCKAQGEYLDVKKDGVETASLHAVIKSVRPALAKNGLCFTQLLNDNDSGERELTTHLGHSSGQYMESIVKIKPLKNDKNQEQSNAATLLFIRKETAKAILGVTIAGDLMDDDADSLYEEPSLDDLDEVMSNPRTPNKKADIYISARDYEELNHEIRDFPELGETLMKKLRITSLAQMKRSDFRKNIDELRELKLRYRKAGEAR